MQAGLRTGLIDGLAFEVAGDGPPLLLIHEGIGDRRSWDPLWAQLSERFTAVRFDARGFGESADPDRDYSRGGDAASVLAAAGVSRARVIGVSMGADTAIELALTHPDGVERLVLVSAAPDPDELPADLIAKWDEVDRLVAAGDIDAANEIEVAMWVDGVDRSAADSDPGTRAAVARTNRDLLVRQAGFEFDPSEPDPPLRERLDELAKLPLLLVTGTHDQPVVRAASAQLAERAGGTVVQLPDTAHVPHLERPEEFARAILGFLEASA